MHKTSQQGFTLIELIIALGIFAFASVILLSVTLILTAVRTKIKSEQEGIASVRALLDTMSRMKVPSSSVSQTSPFFRHWSPLVAVLCVLQMTYYFIASIPEVISDTSRVIAA